ncbi:MAG: spermidine synthase, partial [Nitrospirota bacterium]
MIKFFEKAPYAPVEYSYDVEEILFRGKSKFQEIMVIKNPYYGKMLILDDVVQLTERDEFFYHEMLTHVAMHAHPDPRRVIVIGGGDGGIVREVLKHKAVEKLYFVEIDEEVINVSRKFFPAVSVSIDDPRAEI